MPQHTVEDVPQEQAEYNVVCLCGGSRGDTQPVIAVAHALQKRRVHCVLVGPPEQRDFAEAVGLEYRAFEGSIREWLQTDEELVAAAQRGMKEVMERSGEKLRQDMLKNVPFVLQLIRSYPRPIHAVLASNLEWMPGTMIAETLGIPSVAIWLQPWEPSKEVVCVMVDPASAEVPTEAAAVLATHRKGMAMWHEMLGGGLNALQETAAAARWSEARLMAHVHGKVSDTLPLPLFSAAVYPRGLPSDVSLVPCGFATLPHHADASRRHLSFDAALESFLDAGDPPIYLGWGSSVMGMHRSGEYMATLLTALQRLSMRAVVLRGWQQLSTGPLEGAAAAYAQKNVLVVESVAHELLFPRCAVVLVHGGVGSTAQAMLSGRPILVSPWCYDQFWLAESVREQGLGRRVSPLPSLTADELVQAVREVRDCAETLARCKRMRTRLLAEDGSAEGADRVLRFLGERVAR